MSEIDPEYEKLIREDAEKKKRRTNALAFMWMAVIPTALSLVIGLFWTSMNSGSAGCVITAAIVFSIGNVLATCARLGWE
jgi:hypothetical protein